MLKAIAVATDPIASASDIPILTIAATCVFGFWWFTSCRACRCSTFQKRRSDPPMRVRPVLIGGVRSARAEPANAGAEQADVKDRFGCYIGLMVLLYDPASVIAG